MLNINNVKKSFQTELGSIKRVFKGLELHVEKGDFISIIGSNGAGKSNSRNSNRYNKSYTSFQNGK